jgi:hypothetical protein
MGRYQLLDPAPRSFPDRPSTEVIPYEPLGHPIGQKETSRPALQTLTTLLYGPGEASVHITSDQTTDLDESRSSRLALPRLLLRHGEASVSRVAERTLGFRPNQAPAKG